VTDVDRTQRVADLGFTPRQAAFLVTVMLHAGVCVPRQYCAFSRTIHGANSREFFRRLLARRYATAYAAAQTGARIYHVQYRPLYAAIGEPDSRHRRPTPLPRAVERLMLLDAVLEDPALTWLGTEGEKLRHVTLTLGTRFARADLPRLVFGSGPDQTVRYFPDKLPIGVDEDDRMVFLYLATRSSPVDFRAFLHRHAELLRALPAWTIRVLVPSHLLSASGRFEAAWREELAMPLRLTTVEELRWYFPLRRELAQKPEAYRDPRFARAHRAFVTPRFRALYRAWLTQGDGVIGGAMSPILAEAIARGTGQVQFHVLAHRYVHLFSLVGTA
jgi:hypothetical protein